MSSLPTLVEDLASNNKSALSMIPGITTQIIGAGVGGLFEAYSLGFRFVWISAGCFTVIAAVCKFACSLLIAVEPNRSLVYKTPQLTRLRRRRFPC
jgi:hypothetical protein